MRQANRAVIAGSAIGLLLALWTLDRVGLRQIVAVLVRVGAGGLSLFLLAHLAVLGVLGLAWSASARGSGRGVATFAWARAVREAANELLPFSQLGGLVLGLKVLTDAGLPPARAYAATVIDLTTEIASQLLLVLAGLAIAIDTLAAGAFTPPLRLAITLGAGLLALLCAGFLLLRSAVLALAGRIADRLVPAAGAVIAEVRAELAAFEARRAAILAPFLWNALAWLLSVGTVWLGLALLGQRLPFGRVLALEALISVVRSGAFLVPGAIGVQEAGYVLLAPLFGVPAITGVALSLLKRARDFLIGLPTLLVWQAMLARRRG